MDIIYFSVAFLVSLIAILTGLYVGLTVLSFSEKRKRDKRFFEMNEMKKKTKSEKSVVRKKSKIKFFWKKKKKGKKTKKTSDQKKVFFQKKKKDTILSTRVSDYNSYTQVLCDVEDRDEKDYIKEKRKTQDGKYRGVGNTVIH